MTGTPRRIAVAVAVAVAVLVVLFVWVFPWIERTVADPTIQTLLAG